jgi:hypothetical protein
MQDESDFDGDFNEVKYQQNRLCSWKDEKDEELPDRDSSSFSSSNYIRQHHGFDGGVVTFC